MDDLGAQPGAGPVVAPGEPLAPGLAMPGEMGPQCSAWEGNRVLQGFIFSLSLCEMFEQ